MIAILGLSLDDRIINEENREYMLPILVLIAICACSALLWTFSELPAIIAIPFILMYNGKRGPAHPAVKYGFYAFYPIHLLLLAVIRNAII